jgi:hypothetical protein
MDAKRKDQPRMDPPSREAMEGKLRMHPNEIEEERRTAAPEFSGVKRTRIYADRFWQLPEMESVIGSAITNDDTAIQTLIAAIQTDKQPLVVILVSIDCRL